MDSCGRNALPLREEVYDQAMTPDMFLTDQELVRLTGYKNKSRQIAWLRSEAIPFRVSGTGHPVVTRVAIEGPTRKDSAPLREPWVPAVLQSPRPSHSITSDSSHLPSTPGPGRSPRRTR